MMLKSLKSLYGSQCGSYGSHTSNPLILLPEVYGGLPPSKEGRSASASRPSKRPREEFEPVYDFATIAVVADGTHGSARLVWRACR
jgi:hypothetical protein